MTATLTMQRHNQEEYHAHTRIDMEGESLSIADAKRRRMEGRGR